MGNRTPTEILANPSAYIESSNYYSWEQFFTDLLIQLTWDTVFRYYKSRLSPVYLQNANVIKFLEAMGEGTELS